MQRGPPPRPSSGRRFAPQAAGRPFMDHFNSEAQQFGMRPMAQNGGGPAGRFLSVVHHPEALWIWFLHT